ncbi:CidA/LrgA family protein [Bacillus sp. 2205SS5-2]|uniref:CidA/LrgA family protein n=1 Tax=Bacillus sp. 2205SS5-2 TaxID=3109031 RepID=UPI003006954B
MKKWWMIIGQMAFLSGLYEFGVFLVQHFSLPIPGNVLGMVLLLLLLAAGVVKVEWIEETCTLLLKHMAFFFVPISVGIMTLGGLIKQSGSILLLILLFSTSIGLIATGASSQYVARKKEEVRHG